MSSNEPEELGSVSFQVVFRGSAISRPVTVYLGSYFQQGDSTISHEEGMDVKRYEVNNESESKKNLPKYSCRQCGSDEVRGDFDTYQVYRAEDDKLVHLRSEFTDPVVLDLYCNECGERIEIEDLSEIKLN